MYALHTMASFTKWYPAAEDQIIPWNARFQYPGQAAPAVKTTPRINPKNGSDFNPGNVIRLEFPAQGYINPRNTTLAFDVTLSCTATTADRGLRIQNNIQSLFQRVRLLYGSTPLEDIIDYNQIVRSLTEWTSSAARADQLSVTDGIGLSQPITTAAASTTHNVEANARQSSIQGIAGTTANSTLGDTAIPSGAGSATSSTRRYQVQLALGLFTQDKLLPVKFMASQLAIEITLASAAGCLVSPNTTSFTGATYLVNNVTLIPEILEFDASYDAMFLKGLKEGGVPIKFSTWHNFQFAMTSSAVNVQIQERARSVKSIYALQRMSPDVISTDSHATLFHSNTTGTLQQYQYRIGGRYYPAAPVQCALASASTISNGAAEAFTELGKALHTLGDMRLSSAVTPQRWGYPVTTVTNAALDGYQSFSKIESGLVTTANLSGAYLGGGAYGNYFSQCFCMSMNLETTDGGEISGLNAEEQSDIILQAQYSNAPTSGYILEVFTYFDAMLIIRENNVVELIQ